MGRKATETRRIALEILEAVDAQNVKLHIAVRNVLDKYDYMDPRDKAFIKYLTEGVIQYRIKLDYCIDQYAKVKGRIKPVVRRFLRMGTFQILYMDQVPDSAACNETVMLAAEKGLNNLRGFINGVLRNISRQKNCFEWPANNLSVEYSMPQWICDYLGTHFTKEQVLAILKSSLERRKLIIRINDNLNSDETENLLARMKESGVCASRHPYSKRAYILENASKVSDLPGFDNGKIMVQDISSQLAVELAGIKQGDSCIDMCGAPGGKTVLAAVKCGSEGHVESRDLYDYKAEMIRENVERCGLRNVTVRVQDATEYTPESCDSADVVICDLPCSGLGVLGRKNDIKYNVTAESVKELAELQRNILAMAVKYVKPGGILIYSTCTITTEEDEDNYKWIRDNLELEPVSIEDCLPKELECDTAGAGYIKLLPGIYDSDGFFISKFRKRK